MKKIICLCMCLLLLVPTLTSCSKPPEYGEIEERFQALIEQSYAINELFFGKGMETYERVWDPMSTLKIHTTTDPKDPEKEIRAYYYELKDPTLGRVLAFRTSYSDPYAYLQVLEKEDTARTPYYVSENGKSFYYLLENYEEPKYELYYDVNDPADYDYVRMDAPYHSINEIKAAAEQVYSPDFLHSRYDNLFVGTAGLTDSVVGLSARYIEYTASDGAVYLMQSNTFEALVTERRIYDFSTVKMVKPSNKKYVTLELDSYLESNPAKIVRVRVSMQLVDGQWYLDTPTY